MKGATGLDQTKTSRCCIRIRRADSIRICNYGTVKNSSNNLELVPQQVRYARHVCSREVTQFPRDFIYLFYFIFALCACLCVNI